MAVVVSVQPAAVSEPKRQENTHIEEKGATRFQASEANELGGT